MTEIQAYKMDGLGNDFIIIDRRKDKIDLSKEQIINISDRKKGLGCDQIIIAPDAAMRKLSSWRETAYATSMGWGEEPKEWLEKPVRVKRPRRQASGF